MKRHWIALCAVALLVSIAIAQDKPADKPADKDAPADTPLKTIKDKASYAIGLNIGQSIKRDGLDLDPKLIAQGIADAMGTAKPLLTVEQIRQVLTQFQADMEAKQNQLKVEQAERNKTEGAKFLAANGKKEGVKITASGLQYKVLKDGAGKMPKATDRVRTHYKGTLIDGKVFDSSYDRGEPAVFPVNGVIKGWTEALQLMKVGSKWQVVVPAELAYGARGAGQDIGPNAVLVFEIELLAIVE